MPATLTYPGVYIEEIPSGVRTIAGVATSITAFLGRTAHGPSDATTITSYADFVRLFGGVDSRYPMSYAVRDFYLNAGGQATAVIVRLIGGGSGKAKLTTTSLTLEAASPGSWGNNLFALVDRNGITPDVAAQYHLNADDLFNLTILEAVNGTPGRMEQFANLSVKPDAGGRRIDRVLAADSQLVRIPAKSDSDPSPALPDKRPDPASPIPAASSTSATDASAQPTGDTGGDATAGTSGARGSTRGGATGAATGTALTAPEPAKTFPIKLQGQNFNMTGVVGNGAGQDATALVPDDYTGGTDGPVKKTGLYALEKVDLFNLLCIPPDSRDKPSPSSDPATPSPDTRTVPQEVYQKAMAYCRDRRAMLIVDPPAAWGDDKLMPANTALANFNPRTPLEADPGRTQLTLSGPDARNAALYFPRVRQPDPQRGGQIDTFAACGMIAGVMARTDGERGVWKAPAGIDAALNGIQGLEVNLTDAENGLLNPLGINCLRNFPIIGPVVWGARTARGADQLTDDYKYIPVRRLALYIEESLYRGTKWVVFEPNDEPLWSQIRLNVGAFMQNLFRQGAFQGKSPREAYFVKCDGETTIQNDINLGIVNVIVGFAPLKPAEFVVIKIQQMAGQIAV
ncbi:MAG: phage tail sheath family protein [Herpetosiphonaceae bacterium]|nr:phage tail sheath family protein [Herpetosiphonaceae bacterium]